MSLVASLQMYTTPVLAPAVETWWTGLAAHLRTRGFQDVPEQLITPADIHSVWHRDDMLFSQTCGGPLIQELGTEVRVVGTPIYDAALFEGINYRSAIIAAPDAPEVSLADFKGRRIAINGRESYSGYLAPRATLAGVAIPGQPFFSEVIVSGAHLESLRMVADGEADCAAIDCVTLAIAARDEPDLFRRVKSIATTEAVPGLPYVTRGAASDEELARIREAVATAFADHALADARSQLLLAGLQETTHADYEVIRHNIEIGKNITF